MTFDGDAFRYQTPLNGTKPKNASVQILWRDPDCCTSSGHRIVQKVPQLIYGKGPRDIYIHQFFSSTVKFKLSSEDDVTIRQETLYPTEDTIKITVISEDLKPFSVHLRIPSWVKKPQVAVNGKDIADPKPGTHLRIDRSWRKGDTIEAAFPMETVWLKGEHSNKGI